MHIAALAVVVALVAGGAAWIYHEGASRAELELVARSAKALREHGERTAAANAELEERLGAVRSDGEAREAEARAKAASSDKARQEAVSALQAALARECPAIEVDPAVLCRVEDPP